MEMAFCLEIRQANEPQGVAKWTSAQPFGSFNVGDTFNKRGTKVGDEQFSGKILRIEHDVEISSMGFKHSTVLIISAQH